MLLMPSIFKARQFFLSTNYRHVSSLSNRLNSEVGLGSWLWLAAAAEGRASSEVSFNAFRNSLICYTGLFAATKGRICHHLRYLFLSDEACYGSSFLQQWAQRCLTAPLGLHQAVLWDYKVQGNICQLHGLPGFTVII